MTRAPPLSMRSRISILSSVWLATLLLPVQVLAAAGVADVLAIPDIKPVSRGEFIRTAVLVLKVPVSLRKESVYRGVPVNWRSYVNSANEQGALAVFGGTPNGMTSTGAFVNLQLYTTITRGEALAIIAALEGTEYAAPNLAFRDVPKGSAVERGVAAAVENSWMTPMSRISFGVRKTMNAKEVRDLFRKVTGESEPVYGKPAPTNSVTNDGEMRVNVEIPRTSPVGDIPKQEVFREVWNLLVQQYMRRDNINADEAAYKALEAMVASLEDPYTVFFRPVAAEQFQSQLDGEISGIGVSTEFQSDSLIVITPLPDSPALRAGIKAGDRIVEVDGVSLKGKDTTTAISMVRGKKGTTVKLTILRGDLRFEVSVVRDIIKIAEIAVTWHDKVAVVAISQFGEITARDIRKTLEEIQAKKPTGLILDLRNNPGGLLDAANEVLSNVLPYDTLMASIQTHSTTYEERTIGTPSIAPEVKMAVLVNEGSASASEIVAGALQDTKRAFIVGQKTFGKGVVQNVNTLTDGSILKVTIAEWITPNGNHIDGKGIMPDTVVENRESGRDEQLLTALRLLQ